MKPNKDDQTKDVYDIHKTLSAYGTMNYEVQDQPVTTKLPKRRLGFKRTIASFLLIIFLFVSVIAVWDAIELSKASKKMFGSGNLFSLVGGGGLKGQNSGRVNILLAGYSVDDPGHSGATLTDSIMLISLNASGRSGYILSIPRDLYVNIPGYGYGKINEAYQAGQRQSFNEEGYPSGGMGLLEKVVAEKFATQIDYYGLLNYAAFRDTVNALGGMTVDINSPDPRGLYDPNISPADGGPLKLSNGPQTLDGQTALNLARARGDSYYAYGFPQADFDRTTHQRQMLLALRQKAVSWKTVLNPTKAGHLFDGMADNVKTDVNVEDVLPLYSLINKVNSTNLESVGLRNLRGQNLLTSYGGALIPAAGLNDYSDIQAALAKLNNS